MAWLGQKYDLDAVKRPKRKSINIAMDYNVSP
jgi:hypothetical protein